MKSAIMKVGTELNMIAHTFSCIKLNEIKNTQTFYKLALKILLIAENNPFFFPHLRSHISGDRKVELRSESVLQKLSKQTHQQQHFLTP